MASTITFQCYSCNQVLKVGADKAGKKAKCIKCGTILTIPVASDEEEVKAGSPRKSPPPIRDDAGNDRPRNRRRDENDEDDDRPRSRRSRDEDDDDYDRPRKRRRDEDDEDDRPRSRRSRDDDDDDYDDRPRRRRSRDDDEDDDYDRPRGRGRYDDDEDDYDRPRRRRSRDEDEDYEDDERSQRKKEKMVRGQMRSVESGLYLFYLKWFLFAIATGVMIGALSLTTGVAPLIRSEGAARFIGVLFLIAAIGSGLAGLAAVILG